MILPIHIDMGVSQSKQVYPLMADGNMRNVPMTASSSVSINKDYNELFNKPSINSVTLQGSMSLIQLGLRSIQYDTVENWNAQSTLIAAEGAIYIYSNYSTITEQGTTKNIPAIKIGDGTSYLIDMPFVGQDIAEQLLAHIADTTMHVTADEKTFWNNKSSAFVETAETETLVLSNTHYMINGVVY